MNYLNEIDPFAAGWSRRLADAGYTPPCVVDERDIREVQGHELSGYDQCHFFAGISGWPYALRLAGWDAARPIWTGSCPCQPFSSAGKRRGEADSRHLWPEFRRLIAERNPPVVFGEQVASAGGREWLSRVRVDLEALGYAVGAADLCAAGAGAPHIRQRLYWVADARHESSRCGHGPAGGHDTPERMLPSPDTPTLRVVGGLGDADGPGPLAGRPTAPPTRHGCAAESDGDSRRVENPDRGRFRQRGYVEGFGREAPAGGASRVGFWDAFDLVPCADGKARRIEPGSFPLAHGVPARVGRLRGYGNAIVPQVAALFVRAYMEAAGITDQRRAA